MIAWDDPVNALATIEEDSERERWWVPQDIPTPPSSEPISTGAVDFTRKDVDRVLSDL